MTLKQDTIKWLSERVVIIQKTRGQTPLEALEGFRRQFPELTKVKMTYIGRLDPLAYGSLLILIGDECKNREQYLGLDKIYRVKILLGLETDTFDCLGLVQKVQNFDLIKDKIIVENKINSLVGSWQQKYPWFSSRTVSGRSLFDWFRFGDKDKIERPSREVKIGKMEILSWEEKQLIDLENEVLGMINSVSGDFRQKEIIESWKDIFYTNKNSKVTLVEIRVHCSTGTYMRALAEKISEDLNIPALAWEIEREEVLIRD